MSNKQKTTWVDQLNTIAARAVSAQRVLAELQGVHVEAKWGEGSDRSTLTLRFVRKFEAATAQVTAPAPLGADAQAYLAEACQRLGDGAVDTAEEMACAMLETARQEAQAVAAGLPIETSSPSAEVRS